MVIELRELTVNDGKDIFEMIKEIGPGENGFVNSGYEMSYGEFPKYLLNHVNSSKGIGLRPEYVPQTIYWLYVDDKPVGMGKLRHHLNDNLRVLGGHIGYAIRPSERGKGYGTTLLKEMKEKAKEFGISELLLTCDEDNLLSRRVIEANHGVLQDIYEGECRYWIKLK